MNRINAAIVGFVATGMLVLSGCTSAGPFVTGISSDGHGNLIVEKSNVKMNAFMGTVSNEGSTTTVIKILPDNLATK
jgi:type IV secretion system protein VirB7